jgi:hypothetical protein
MSTFEEIIKKDLNRLCKWKPKIYSTLEDKALKPKHASKMARGI